MNIYDKVPVKVQKKSGFDKSFQNLFTSKVGTITPILTDELIPNTTVNLKMAISTQLPPLASDTFMRVKQKYAAFFVPTRLLVSDYEKWLTGQKGNAGSSSNYIPVMPEYRWQPSKDGDHFKPGSLADYLGYKVVDYTPTQISSVTATTKVCALPFLAYHRIYNDWFRNSLVQKDIYADTVGTSYACASQSFRHFWNGDSSSQYMTCDYGSPKDAHSDLFNDGVRLWELRQANFGSDIFTSCTPSPQNGEAQSVSFAMPENAGDDGSFTISALRAANSMQQFLERNNLAGNRLVDYVRAQYGANLNDAIAQRPILLGAGSFDVYSKGIYQTTNDVTTTGTTSGTTSVKSTNPFNTVGTRFGSAYVDGNDLLIKGFTAQEPGYLMVVTWLS